MQILITEFMDEAAVAQLREAHDVLYDPQLVDDPVSLQREALRADAIVVRNRTQVRGELLAALARCTVVGRLGVGLDNIDVPACKARGMRVIPATGANALSVAEYVITAAMLLLRGAYASTADVAVGRWPRSALSGGRELRGKMLGLIGFGSIGQLTADLSRALGMRVIAYDAVMKPDDPAFVAQGVVWQGLDSLVARADVVSLHIPLVESPRGMFNAARGGIVDEQAVAAALRSGQLGGAALDVFGTEPLATQAHFQGCPNLLLTPHIAGVTCESNERVSSVIAAKVLEALR